ncbi:MAG TPA: hypothetical protein VEG60_32160 [Candidatus Binatia bacterium]|nr:hypothetical protein [Candidatus Binatia bacterium]
MRLRGVILAFVVGIALGVSGTIYGPELVAPYFPEAIQRRIANIEGTVVTKRREGDRLLLMVQTKEGSMLVSFKKKVAEVELLVSEGDLITFLLRQYQPFAEDPGIGRVRKEAKKPQLSEPSPVLSGEKEPSPQ